jgi:GntR family transcriptional repressor for pyruvate dehydrogenase complex
MFKKIQPVRLYESVADQIINLIKRNELKPGDKLPPERELANNFSISRASIREAFRVLESRGLIKSTPGGGRFIREIDKNSLINTDNVILNLEKSSILELLEAREIFEVKIVELAVKRASAEDIKEIEQNFNRMCGIGRGNYKDTEDAEKTELDTEFHLAIARASRNFVFINVMRLHLELLNTIRNKTWQIKGRQKEQENEHKEILQAIKEHNSKKAGQAMLNHLKKIREVITEMKTDL